MKFKKEALRKIIQEELQAVLSEQLTPDELKSIGMTADQFKSLRDDEKAAYTKMAKGETETITDKPTMIKGRRRDPKLQINQQIYNMVLKRINSKLPPLETDGLYGTKTRTAGQKIRKYIRKNLPRGTTIAAGIEQILGAGMKTLRQVARRKILDNDGS